MLDAARIAETLPHRFPMLLVDRVTELVPGDRLTACKAVTTNEPWYGGSRPCSWHGYPAVLLIESWCQAAGVLAVWDAPNPDVRSGQVMLFGSMAGVRLVGEVVPGDVLEHHVRLVRALSDTVIVEGESLVSGRCVLDVERVVLAMRPAASLAPAPATAPTAATTSA